MSVWLEAVHMFIKLSNDLILRIAYVWYGAMVEFASSKPVNLCNIKYTYLKKEVFTPWGVTIQ